MGHFLGILMVTLFFAYNTAMWIHWEEYGWAGITAGLYLMFIFILETAHHYDKKRKRRKT